MRFELLFEMSCFYPSCTPSTCICAASSEDITASKYERAQKTLQILMSEFERVKHEYKEAGEPFGPDGLGTWLEYGGESGVN
jgi:hypothetical protein